MKITECPICKNSPRPLYQIERFQEPFTILECPECGLQMQSSIPDNPSNFYDESYYSGSAEFSYKDERRKTKYENYVWNARLKNISKYLPPPRDFLDVGASFGGFVEAASKFGYNARGIDPSPYAVTEGKKAGRDLILEEFTPEILPPASVDILTMIEVIEHLPDPQKAFRAMKQIVRPGGMVLIQTANFLGLQARREKSNYHYYLPGHLFYYSVTNLRRILRENGFSKTVVFQPTDFGLLPKLQKSRGDFKNISDYLRWLSIAKYHLKSKIHLGNFSWTSSMCLYAFRDSE